MTINHQSTCQRRGGREREYLALLLIYREKGGKKQPPFPLFLGYFDKKKKERGVFYPIRGREKAIIASQS